jgi:hypothetical protein
LAKQAQVIPKQANPMRVIMMVRDHIGDCRKTTDCSKLSKLKSILGCWELGLGDVNTFESLYDPLPFPFPLPFPLLRLPLT